MLIIIMVAIIFFTLIFYGAYREDKSLNEQKDRIELKHIAEREKERE